MKAKLTQSNKRQILDLVRDHSSSLEAIGARYGVSKAAISYLAKKAGIHRRSMRRVDAHPMELTQEYVREVLGYCPDTGVFSRRRAAGKVGWVDDLGYLHIRISRKKLYLAHRLAWLYVYGCWPNGNIDHINGNPADNRICNLREATQLQNNWNAKIVNKRSKFRKGVCFDPRRKKYRAYIKIDGKQVQLGRFDDADSAVAAREAAEVRVHGKFARRS